MKIIALDIDGVLMVNGIFSQAAVKNLNDLLDKVPDLNIIISSSWRHRGLNFVKNMLKQAGVNACRVIDRTDLTDSDDRGHHIERWIEDNSPDAFVVLDDKADMAGILDHLVQTNPHVGLTSADTKKALDILSKPC